MRPFMLGRKNWLFSQSMHGADASALLHSLVETSKANGLEPWAYPRMGLVPGRGRALDVGGH